MDLPGIEEEKKMLEDMTLPQLQLRASLDSVDRDPRRQQSSDHKEQSNVLSEEEKAELVKMVV